uniref:Uncharacterized protein n=2 Tax=Human herpesvirus 1 TaxID=10298 RepID=A0A2U9A5X3_HHV1|nr:hypothetical protein [Human alphaherpesvirus 1]AWO69240.1 hypothetical protein [Human alphaherpesvirus 1]AWO69340.1 hypothetical protein [Human alphaherpesvirus 1]AWO69440.1 hypothetical protein [Human alphaherpesvirus 1]AWO69731.1 hypothetical protein [Human alphaherpesvirus 1]
MQVQRAASAVLGRHMRPRTLTAASAWAGLSFPSAAPRSVPSSGTERQGARGSVSDNLPRRQSASRVPNMRPRVGGPPAENAGSTRMRASGCGVRRCTNSMESAAF